MLALYTPQAYIPAVDRFIEMESFARAREKLLDDAEYTRL